MLKAGAERLPPSIRQRQTTRLVLLTVATLVILALVCSTLLRFWSGDRHSEARYGSGRRGPRTRITLCTQVLNEVRVLVFPRAVHANGSADTTTSDADMQHRTTPATSKLLPIRTPGNWHVDTREALLPVQCIAAALAIRPL